MCILLFINAIISLGGQLIVPSNIESMNDILRGRVLILKGTELNIWLVLTNNPTKHT